MVSPSTYKYDIEDVVPVEWVDRTLFVQPVVNPSTESACASGSASCTKPTPFVLESLRPLGGTYGWVKTNLTTNDPDGLRGVDMELDLSYDRYVLYYASSGHGVYVSTVEW